MNLRQIVTTSILCSILIGSYLYLNQQSPQSKTSHNQPDQSQLRQQLTRIFADSYPSDITPTGNTVEINLVAAQSTVEVAGQPLQTWAYNDQVPGPAITAQQGDLLKVTLTNQLPQPTTLHWHGVRVPNQMDGVPDVTQTPVDSGNTFTYEFLLRDAGTFWYHPHVRGSEQVERGLYGALVVQPADPLPYQQDLTLVLDDWLLSQNQINPYFNTPHDLMHDGRWGNLITLNSRSTPGLTFQPGERVRLRLINTANARVFRPQFTGLAPQVIAIDGMLVAQPFPLRDLDLAPGNRIDLDITMPDQPTDAILWDYFSRLNIRLADISIQGPVVTTADFPLPHATQIPDWSAAQDLKPDHTFTLDALGGHMMAINWAIDKQIYPDITPLDLQANTFQKLRITNNSSRFHPMHLHGQFFQVLSRNGQTVDEKYWRDTVLLYGNDTVDIGLIPLDRGSWAYHCHILEHAESGMMTLINVN